MIPLKETFLTLSRMVGAKIDEEMQRKIGGELRYIMTGRATRLAEFGFIWRIGKILRLPWYRRLLLTLIAYPALKRAARRAPPVKGVVEAIINLKERPNMRLGLVTSRSRRDTIHKLKILGVLQHFDAIVTRDDVKTFKPSPEQVRLASRMLHVPVESCVLVGDMPTDVFAAREAGVLAVGVATGIFHEEVRSSNPDLIIASAADLPKSLSKICDRLRRIDKVRQAPESLFESTAFRKSILKRDEPE
ncbi:HAD-IA family hydrolase [Candidatus Bathyarchaeota archaeon]|nr:HAD-IA family hydrolase [Candidatus Bathyarchaeota archaeon]